VNSPLPKPAIILSEPQLGENIGACARAMANFKLSDLRIVAPRDGWPNPKAEAMAANAAQLVAAARIYESVKGAIGGLHLVYATTGRDRSMANCFTSRFGDPASAFKSLVTLSICRDWKSASK